MSTSDLSNSTMFDYMDIDEPSNAEPAFNNIVFENSPNQSDAVTTSAQLYRPIPANLNVGPANTAAVTTFVTTITHHSFSTANGGIYAMMAGDPLAERARDKETIWALRDQLQKATGISENSNM
jgi:hypothetical protein